jgi:hypothetical protein
MLSMVQGSLRPMRLCLCLVTAMCCLDCGPQTREGRESFIFFADCALQRHSFGEKVA